MKINKLFFLVAILLVLINFSGEAVAIPMLKLDDGFTSITIADGGAGDWWATPGAVTFVGSVGSFSANVSTGITKPLYGTETNPVIDLNSVYVTSFAGGTLRISFTETDFSSSDFPNDLIAFYISVGGTTTGNVAFNSYWDPNNNGFAETNLLSSLGGFGPMAFSNQSGSGFYPFSPDAKFSLTVVATITHAGAGLTSFDAMVSPVPEPAAMFLVGAGLIGIAELGKKKFFNK